jgi:hypothetical protein
MTFYYPKFTKGKIASLLSNPKTPAWSKSLYDWCMWHANQVRIETRKRVSAWNAAGGPSSMWKYYQAWVHLHRMYVQLYKALIGADATTAWYMFFHAKQAEARVDFLCTKWRQSTYPLEMTEALEEVHAKRALTAKFVYA